MLYYREGITLGDQAPDMHLCQYKQTNKTVRKQIKLVCLLWIIVPRVTASAQLSWDKSILQHFSEVAAAKQLGQAPAYHSARRVPPATNKP